MRSTCDSGIVFAVAALARDLQLKRVGDPAVRVAGGVLVDERGAHVVVTHAVHQVPGGAGILRQPFDVVDAVPIITDPHTRRVGEVAALAYELVLHLLTRFFTHTDETDQQLDVLINCAVETMANVLHPIATTLTALPIGPEHPGRTAGFSFEMFYAMGNLVPWREPALALLHERASILADHCTELPDDTATAVERAAATAANLAAHVPTDLLATSI